MPAPNHRAWVRRLMRERNDIESEKLAEIRRIREALERLAPKPPEEGK